jgi:hypothetical protein
VDISVPLIAFAIGILERLDLSGNLIKRAHGLAPKRSPSEWAYDPIDLKIMGLLIVLDCRQGLRVEESSSDQTCSGAIELLLEKGYIIARHEILAPEVKTTKEGRGRGRGWLRYHDYGSHDHWPSSR